MPLQSTVSPLVSGRKAGIAIGNQIADVQKKRPQEWQAWQTLQNSVNDIYQQLGQSPKLLGLTVVDPNGNLVAQIGDFDIGGVYYPGGAFANLWVGPGANPATAPFFSDGQHVVIGRNGQVYLFDPYSNVGAWLGTQTEAPQNVSGAANNGSGAIRLTVTAHGYRSGDWVNAATVGGVPNATGQWVISVFDANNFDLLGSTFAGTYTSGGTVNRFFSGGAFSTIAVAAGQRITNVVNNGSGLVRLTITGHGYATGYAVTVTNVQGVPGANGDFLVTVIDPNTVDLQGSTFSGTYVSGGISLNWPTAKLLAQGDGSLLLQNAKITVSGPTSSIVIDPSTGAITVTQVGGGGPPFNQATIQSGTITLDQIGTGASSQSVTIEPNEILLVGDATNVYEILMQSGSNASLIEVSGNSRTAAESQQIQLFGYTGTTSHGPVVACYEAQGSGASPTATQSGDTLGGLIATGYDGVGESTYNVSFKGVAGENHAVGAHGGYAIIEATATGSTTPGEVARFTSGGLSVKTGANPNYALDVAGDISSSGVFRHGATAGISVTRNMVASVSTSGSAVFGTPGAGQSNGSVVTGVSLTSTSFSGGIITT